MLKILKHEYKNVLFATLFVLALSLIWFIIAFGFAFGEGGFSNAKIFDQALNAFLVIAIVGICAQLSIMVGMEEKLYGLSTANKWQVLLCRIMLVFAATFAVTLIFICESTLIESIAIKSNSEANKIIYLEPNGYQWGALSEQFVFGLCGRGFASWLLPFATGLFAVFNFSIYLAAMPAIKKAPNVFAKIIFGSLIVCGIGVIYFISVPVINIACDAANFNAYISTREQFGYSILPTFSIQQFLSFAYVSSLYGLSKNICYFGINIFSLGELFFTLVFIVACLGLYLLNQNKEIGIDDTKVKKVKIYKSLPAATLLIAIIIMLL